MEVKLYNMGFLISYYEKGMIRSNDLIYNRITEIRQSYYEITQIKKDFINTKSIIVVDLGKSGSTIYIFSISTGNVD